MLLIDKSQVTIAWPQGHTASCRLPFYLVLHQSSALSSVMDQSMPSLCRPSTFPRPDYMTFRTGVHCNLAFMLSSSLSGAVACANPSMKSAFAPARNRKEHTSAADCGNLLPSGLLFYLGLVIFLRLRTPSKEFHSSEVEPALPQAKCEPMLAPQLEYVPECFIMLLGHCDED